jgi:hypothetical protein
MVLSALAIMMVSGGFIYYTLTTSSSSGNPSEGWTTTHNFWWNPEEQNITSGKGPLWLNFTFGAKNGNLSIIVNVNDDDNAILGLPDENGATLVLVFDANKNGEIDYFSQDRPYDFRANNKTEFAGNYSAISIGPNGDCTFPSLLPEPSPFHTCLFSNITGYSFNITLPLEDVGTTGMVYAIFVDWDNWITPWEPGAGPKYAGGMHVWTQFSYLP